MARIKIIQWRECFDDEDELLVSADDGDFDYAKQIIEEHDLNPDLDADIDSSEKGVLLIVGDRDIHDGEVINGYRINVTKEWAGPPKIT